MRPLHIDHMGNEFSSLDRMCQYWSVTRKTYTRRLDAGMSVKEALIGPGKQRRAGNSKHKERLGETIMQKCGVPATIVRYGSTDDIDVRFSDDGSIVKNRTYANFVKGSISRYPTESRKKRNRCGETVLQKCGMQATIIDYKNDNNLAVQLEDGLILRHQSLVDFYDGNIQHPDEEKIVSQIKNERLGETKMQKCGMPATIIHYHSTSNIDVQFEDGEILCGKAYNKFAAGLLGKNGTDNGRSLEMYHAMNDTEVRKEKGRDTVYTDHMGNEFRTIEKMCCFWNVNENTYHTRRRHGYSVREALLGPGERKRMKILNPERCGETIIQKCGIPATIVRYGGVNDIDVRFENDGTIVTKRCYERFAQGYIRHPNMIKYRSDRCGQTVMQKCGFNATIITYKNANDIDVQFEDGTIIRHRCSRDFFKGYIRHPKAGVGSRSNESQKDSRMGKTKKQNCGMGATIVDYRGSKDIDVQFEDGELVCGLTYRAFSNRQIQHPVLKMAHCMYKSLKCDRAFREENETYYNVHCCICGMDDILNVGQMREHLETCSSLNKETISS